MRNVMLDDRLGVRFGKKELIIPGGTPELEKIANSHLEKIMNLGMNMNELSSKNLNDDSKSIHEFDVNLICEYFSRLERQGLRQSENDGHPQIAVQETYLKEYAGNETAGSFVAAEQHEMKRYPKYKEYYSYMFISEKNWNNDEYIVTE